MAKRKVTTVETVDEDREVAGSEGAEILTGQPTDAEVVENSAIDELKALGADDGVKWRVSKIPVTPGERGGYYATYTSGELSLDAIRDTFGGGKYSIRGTDTAGRYVAHRTIEIVALPKPASVAVTPAAGPDMQGLAQIVAALKPTGDGGLAAAMTMMTAVLQSQGEMMRAMMSRPREETKLTDILALINATKEKTSPADMLLQGVKLAKELGGEGGETGLMDLAGKGLDVLSSIARQAPAALPAPARARLPAPTTDAAPAAGTTPARPAVSSPPPGEPAKADPMLQKLNWLRQQTAMLCFQAQKGGDPELYAAVLLDNLPPFITDDEIYQRLQSPTAVQELAVLDARVTANAAWFETFRRAVLASFEDDTGGQDDPPGGDIDGLSP